MVQLGESKMSAELLTAYFALAFLAAIVLGAF
jgi:hypothetical protein